MITKWEKDYDILITGINLGLFEYNIAPFFHSGQAKTGYNFSKLKNLALDTLLEDIKSHQLDNDRLRAVKSQILEILKNEAVIKTFYSPYNIVYIDRNLKNTSFVENIPYAYCVYDTIRNAYIKEKREMVTNNKNLFNYIQWILKLIF
jgi:ABC-type oligopeptide transport system substrate-binding subunit